MNLYGQNRDIITYVYLKYIHFFNATFLYFNLVQSSVQSQLLQFQEENNSLRSKIRALETASQELTEQEKLIGNCFIRR